jgi:hypothetical protein
MTGKYTTVKSTAKGKNATLAMRQARALKQRPDVSLTRSARVKMEVR